MTTKTLDQKLEKIKADPNCGEFILADAKDADMAYGVAAPGQSPEHHSGEARFRSLEEYRECIRQVVRQGIVDIMLVSAHTSSILTINEGIFEGSTVTPAARANDTTDIHVVRGGTYATQPSAPFQTTTIDHIQCGRAECTPDERERGANLGLYSVTFNNDLDLDRRTLEAYKEFRLEAEAKSFRHFLEVFDPNAPRSRIDPKLLGGFVNDMIVRMLAGVPAASRPIFIKMAYHGPRFTEELAAYDPTLVIGVLGGSSGTTFDAFSLLADAQKHGARAALFGRKINNAEHQLAFVEMLRCVADGELSPEEAVHAYHGVLQGLDIKPQRCLDDDLKLTDPCFSYGGSVTTVTVDGARSKRPLDGNRTAAVAADRRPRGPSPDLAGMSSAERLAYHRARLKGRGAR